MSTEAKADPVRALIEEARRAAEVLSMAAHPHESPHKKPLIDAAAAAEAALAQQAGAVDQNPVAFEYRSRQWAGDEFTGDWHSPNMPRSFYDARPGAYETRDLYGAPQPAIPEWFDDVLRCLQDVATEFRARGRDARRFEQLANRMLAKRSWEGE